MLPQAFKDSWVAIAAVVPDKLEEAEIKLLQAAVGHIRTYPAMVDCNALDNSPQTEEARVVEKDDFIRSFEPDIQGEIV